MSTKPTRAKLYLAIAIHQLIGAFAFPITKLGVAEAPPFTFALFRFIVASLILLALVGRLGDKVKITRSDGLKIAALGILIVWINQTLYIWGQSLTSASHGSLLFAFTPVFALALSIYKLKERFTWSRLIGATLAVLGGVVIVSQRGVSFSADMLLGDGMILIAVLAWAVYTVYGKPLVQKYGAFKVTTYATVTGTISYIPFGVIQSWEVDILAIGLSGWLAIIYMGSALSVVAYVLWYWTIRHHDVSRIAPFHNFQPVIATIVAYYWLDEAISGNFILGGLLVIAGVLVVELLDFPSRKSQPVESITG